MTSPKQVSLFLSALIGATLLLVLALYFRTPRYAGKSVEHWIAELPSSDEARRTNAVTAMRALGTNALPVIVSRVEAQDSVLWSRLARILRSKGIPVAPSTNAQWAYREAQEALWALGTNASAAIPELVKMLDHPATANRASGLLCEMGNEVIPALLVATTNRNVEVRRRSIVDLGHRRVNKPGVVAGLLHAFEKDADPSCRAMAAYALGKIPNLPVEAINTLADAIQNPKTSSDVVRSVKQALGERGAGAAAISDTLNAKRGVRFNQYE